MIGRRSFLMTVSTVIASMLSLIGLLFMTRYLGPDIYGSFVWILATLTIFNTFSDMGFGITHIKRISEGKDDDDCLSTYIVIKLILIGLMVIIALGSFVVWTVFLGGLISSDSSGVLLLFILYYILYDLAAISTTTFTARMETAKTQIIAIIEPLIRVPLIIFVCLNFANIYNIALIYVVTAIIIFLISLVFLFRTDIDWKHPTLFRSYISFATPMAVIMIVGTFSTNIDKILIGFFDNSTYVGYYSPPQMLLSIMGVVGSSVATLTFPLFSNYYQKGNITGIRDTTLQAERYISMIGIPVLAFMFIFPTEICSILFGSEYAPAGEVMRFLSISTFLTLLNSVYDSQVTAVNRPDLTMKLTILMFILNLVLMLIFIPNEIFGIPTFGFAYKGAAIAYVLSTLTIFVLTRIIVWKLTGTPSNKKIFIHILSVGIAGGVLYSISTLFPLINIFYIIIYSLAMIALFISLMFVLREFTRTDLDYFLDIINLKKMKSYISSEVKKTK